MRLNTVKNVVDINFMRMNFQALLYYYVISSYQNGLENFTIKPVSIVFYGLMLTSLILKSSFKSK